MTTVVWPNRSSLPMDAMKTVGQNNELAGKGACNVRIVMAGGGTGGHLYPGLAVAECLRTIAGREGKQVELIWAATPRAVDQRLLGGFGANYVQQGVQPLTKSIGKLWGFWKAWRGTCAYWRRAFIEHPVDCVVALGGYAAGPAAYVASRRKVPVVLLNPDALPGLANRFLIKRADVVVSQWALAAKGKAVVKALGCPIRPELVGRTREEGAKRLGVDEKLKTLVVTGASLGAKTINDAMIEVLKAGEVRKAFAGAGGWQIIHLAGMEQAEAVRVAYAAYPDVRVKVIDYCDDMASVWAVADLAIARAGASTCAELTACGVPAVLMPYPFHKDMHQKANALELVKNGAAVIVDDAKDAAANGRAVKAALESLLYDAELRDRMAKGSRASGKPQAAEEIAREILRLIDASLR